ncbi:hypothetical protein PVAP13_3NG178145 [Panicum virgatum]|uniref:Uncharacterized protein n=1 Tax=Panicum virgatum TaxID=38727 RepID=A0A8T0U5G2_PANVG|nr:hypothetical protein PVAP13_3NG178145 [Panicum virgatum]
MNHALPRRLLLPDSFLSRQPHAPPVRPEASAPVRLASGGSLLYARLEGGGERGVQRRAWVRRAGLAPAERRGVGGREAWRWRGGATDGTAGPVAGRRHGGLVA